MKNRTFHLLFFLPFLLFAYGGCKKNTLQNQIDKLPAITQEGKRTFGCLVNGKAWIPEKKDIYLATPALRFYYENYRGGQFSIRAKLIIGNIDQSINIGVDSCTSSKNYMYRSSDLSRRVAFNDYKVPTCITFFSSDSDVITLGNVNITRFDLQYGIISGTFDFTLSKPGCETISITHGRFDAKL